MSVISQTSRSLGAVLAVGFLTLCLGTGAAVASATPSPPAPSAAPSTGPSSAPSAASASDGPQFYSDLLVDVSGVVDGDVYASGQNVVISGDVRGDVIAAAQVITITGTVTGDVRLAGQDVTISGDVSRSATIFAATITVADTGTLGADLVGGAESITIAGDVGRNLLVGVGNLGIDGSVGGNATYYSDTEARIAAGAVGGSVERVAPPEATEVEPSPWQSFVSWFLGLLYALVALSLVTLAAGLLIPRWLQRVTDHLVPSPWKALLVGFVASVAVPFALLFLLVTIIGAPLALAGLLVWTVLTLATFVYGAFYIGRLLFRGNQHPVVKSLVGGLILITALQIPWLNVVVWLAMVLFGLGAQLLEVHRQRPWRIRSTADTAPPPQLPATVGDAAPTRTV